MPATMNHLYHTLSPLVLYASFLVSLLAFLAPTPIFPDRVSLLSVTLGGSVSSSSTSTSTSTMTKRWFAESDLADVPDERRMVKRAKKANAAGSQKSYKIVYGPLGACVSVDSSDLACTSPTFTPSFVSLYSSNTTLSPSTVSLLPEQFPLAPAALFVSLLLLATQFLSVVASSISMHVNKKGKAPALAKKQPAMRKVATVSGVLGLAALLASTLALRAQLATVVDQVKKARVGEATLGSGFAQLFAGAALEIFVLILLVAEAFTSR